MNRNLARLTNAANRLDAWKDWNKMAQLAIDKDQKDLALKLKPPSNAGWRKIDKATAQLRKELGEPCPHCDDTGRIDHGYMRDYFCGCEIGKKLQEAS